jgi:hypothetical protein
MRGIYLLEFRFDNRIDARDGLRVSKSENAAPSSTGRDRRARRSKAYRQRFADELSERFSSRRGGGLAFREQLVGYFDRYFQRANLLRGSRTAPVTLDSLRVLRVPRSAFGAEPRGTFPSHPASRRGLSGADSAGVG